MNQTISVTEILQTVESSVDFDLVDDYPGDTMDDQRTAFWQDVIASKAFDTGFGLLVNSILENGFDPQCPIGWDDDAKEITEGHHRLVAAILLGMDEVPYSLDGRGDGRICAHWNDSEPHSIKVELY